MDWADALLRFQAASTAWPHTSVALYRSQGGSELHSTPFCSPSASRVELTPDEAIESAIPSCSDCTGWTSTKFGFELASARESFVTIDADADEVAYTAWAPLYRHMGRHRAVASTAQWSHNADLDAVREEACAAVLRIADRSRPLLDVAELLYPLAAHGVHMPVRASQLPDFANWARSSRLLHGGPRRSYPAFDAALTDVLASARVVLLALRRDARASNPADWRLSEEAALLAWHQGHAEGDVVFVSVPDVVAAGVAELDSRGAADYATRDETRPQVLETTAVLWGDPGSAMTLTEALEAASLL